MAEEEHINLQLASEYKSTPFQLSFEFTDADDARQKILDSTIEYKEDLLDMLQKVKGCTIEDGYSVALFVDGVPTLMCTKKDDDGPYKAFVNVIEIKSMEEASDVVDEMKEKDDCIIV